jgi:hypothetical protein
MSINHDRLRRLVDGHFAKGLSLADEARLRGHLPTCTACREAYASYLVAERLAPKTRTPRERLAVALGLPPDGEYPPRRGFRWAIGTASVAGALALLLVLTTRTQPGSGMVSRGKSIDTLESLEVAVFRVKGERESMRVKGQVSRDDQLAFAYRNELGKSFLMIFAIDGAGQTFWYYPAWTDPADNPRAVPITKQVGLKELPEAVRHALRGSSLTVHALFMDKALDARTVEARVAQGEFAADADAGEVLRTLVFEVRP